MKVVTFLARRGKRPIRPRGTAALAFVGALILTGLTLAVAPQSASAADFAISTPAGTFFTGSITVSGSKEPGTYVQVTSAASDAPHCIVPGVGEPTDGETWSCTFAAGSGELAVSASQYPADDRNGAVVGPLSVTVRNLTAPTIDGPEPLVTAGLVSGSGLVGASILISAGGTQYTTVAQAPSGFWSYPLPLSSGSYDVSVSQQWAGTPDVGPSTTRSVIIDKDPPPLPAITAPAAGSSIDAQPVTFAGTGEDGSRVDVFVDGVTACSGIVAAGVWSCAASGIADGSRTIQGIQWDVAGNASGATSGFTVTIASPTQPEPQPSQPPAAPAPAPVAPAPTPNQSTTPTPTTPFLPPPVGGFSGLPPGETWGTATDYGAAIPDIFGGGVQWGWAVLLGLAFVLLIALPLRLLSRIASGRVNWRFWRRANDDPPVLGPWTTAAAALAASIMLAALAGGIQGEVRYLRLVVAIGIALVALNGVGVALASKLSSRAFAHRSGIRILPLFLAVAAVTALVSRTGGIQPPIIVGVVIAAAFAADLGARGRGIVSLAQVGAVLVMGCAAWLGHSALGPQVGFWASLASETLAALTIAALGSLILLLLPVAGMPGRYLFEWSPVAWGGIAVLGGTAAAAVVALSSTFPLALLLVGAGLLAAVCVATWAWLTYVQPQLAASAG